MFFCLTLTIIFTAVSMCPFLGNVRSDGNDNTLVITLILPISVIHQKIPKNDWKYEAESGSNDGFTSNS